MLDYGFENAFKTDKVKIICGVDEAGRGPLMGPVVAAACILPEGFVLDGLNDSKKLTEKKREALFDVIKENAISYCVAMATVEEIEEFNILKATMLAMNRAVDGLSIPADMALIDGDKAIGFKIPTKTIVKGDAIVPSISAASILAKVTRDHMCMEYDKEYPDYGFAKHKGYGTKAHMDAIRKYGPCPVHRMSFLKFLDK